MKNKLTNDVQNQQASNKFALLLDEIQSEKVLQSGCTKSKQKSRTLFYDWHIVGDDGKFDMTSSFRT